MIHRSIGAKIRLKEIEAFGKWGRVRESDIDYEFLFGDGTGYSEVEETEVLG